MKKFQPVVLLVSGLLSLSSGTAGAQSSEIPDKREFPLNPSINPCDDFYGHVCSKVDASFKLREDRARHVFSFNDSAERILKFKIGYFGELKNKKPRNTLESNLKNYYMACLSGDERKKEEAGLEQKLQKELEGIKDRAALLRYFREKTLAADVSPIDLQSIDNQQNPRQLDVFFDTNFMTLPEKSYYENAEVLDGLKKLLVAFFTQVKAPNPEAKAQKVLEFEQALAKTYPSREEQRRLYTAITGIKKQELEKNFEALELAEMIKTLPKHTLYRQLLPESLTFLNQALKTWELADLKDVYLYFALSPYLDESAPDFFQQKFQFQHKFLGGPPVRPALEERCTRMAMRDFNMEIDSLLWRDYFPSFDEKKFIKMAEKIRATLIKTLEQNKWLSTAARSEAIKKIRLARLQLVSPKTTKEWNFNLPGKYAAGQYIANKKQHAKLVLKKTYRDLRVGQNPDVWHMGPLTINAYYSPSDNKFVMPVGILQYPMYDQGQSEAANLGGIGAVIGHELGHGIDDEGSKFDHKGVLRTWMTESDLKAFHDRGAIFIEQFNQAEHNGKLTLGENIGDFVGLSNAIRATNQTEKELKELFIQYGRSWCGVMLPKQRELLLKTDSHALGVARVNEQVKQRPEFKQVFACKDGDAMTLPKEKLIDIW